MPRIALHGRPGAGKSTFADLLMQELAAGGSPAVNLKLAAPLYELQAIVHAMAGRPLLDGSAQDGQLLNALGMHLRRINPHALTEAFTLRVLQAERSNPSAVLVCDDLRAPDIDAVKALGFSLVEITAPDTLRRLRKRERADLSPGSENHPTEAPITAVPWRRVDNSGSLDDLRAQAARLAQEIRR